MPIRKNSKKRQVILEALAATPAPPPAQGGRVIDVPLPGAPEPQLCALAQSVTDAQVLGCSITFTGLCKACQQAAKEAASK